MRSISFGFAVLTAVLLSACAIDNPTDVALPDAGPCGTMGAACCPQVATAPTGARTICRSAGLTCQSSVCVACGAPGQPCCSGSVAGDGGTSMDAGAAGTCSGTATCLANTCVNCSGPTQAICNGACTELTTDQNCGACGMTCAAAERCVRPASGADAGAGDAGFTGDGGARVAFCQIQCPPGQRLCGNTCRDLNADINNCGGCDLACPTPPVGGTAVCTFGMCRLSMLMCPSDRRDCNAMAGDGCEAQILTDTANCGTCGNTCSNMGGTASCAGGVCNIACSTGLGNCDGNVTNGCEVDTQTSLTHCGACNRACSLPNATSACNGGVCRIATCNVGFADCDSNVLNGCETNTNIDGRNCGACGTICVAGQTCQVPTGGTRGACATTCAATQTNCSGSCRDLATDNANCGACGTVCTGGTSCSGRSCVCPSGQTNCTGTCRALQTDNANCGTCGRVCGAGTVCSDGMCTSTCASPTTNCSGVCRDLPNDPNNCNACGTVCSRTNGVAGCRTGACFLAACNTGFANCDGTDANGCETNTATTATNCGACGNICQFANAGATCANGRCVMGTCATGFRDCNNNPLDGCETNIVAGNLLNCGGCGTACPAPPVGASAVCSNSACTTSIASCPGDRRDCDANSGNGCETLILTDVNNCSACGTRCSTTGGTASCVGGVCAIACSTGLGNCDGNVANGCETNTNTSALNCGACNRLCTLPNAVAGCSAGSCTVTTCNTGFADCNGVATDGCEVSLSNDRNNCGACANACGGGRVCVSGACQSACGSLSTCGTGTNASCRDLTTDPDACSSCSTVCSNNGMATRTCTASACSGTCAAGRADCNSNRQTDGCETDTNVTVTACGGCGMACSTSNVTATCAGGLCTGACASGFADCNADKRTDGCEVNTTNSASHCGGCGTVCPARANAAATPCVSSACTIGTCNSGFANCNGTAGDGCEVNTTNTVAHCGGCNMPCTAPVGGSVTCVAGACVPACPAGQQNCGGTCRATTTDSNNCGSCGNVCVPPAGGTTSCVASTCTPACPAGQTACSGVCRATQTDATNCGTCGNVCATPANSTPVCIAGSCGINCLAGFASCDGTNVNGCEATIGTNANCGSCVAMAPSTVACVSPQTCQLMSGVYSCQDPP